jgi:hypothetical protein
MFDTTVFVSENDAVDWRGLADEIFPSDALRTVSAVNPLVFTNSAA